jgi:hypothetical protein
MVQQRLPNVCVLYTSSLRPVLLTYKMKTCCIRIQFLLLTCCFGGSATYFAAIHSVERVGWHVKYEPHGTAKVAERGCAPVHIISDRVFLTCEIPNLLNTYQILTAHLLFWGFGNLFFRNTQGGTCCLACEVGVPWYSKGCRTCDL